MLSSSLNVMQKLFRTTSPHKLFPFDCIILFMKSKCNFILKIFFYSDIFGILDGTAVNDESGADIYKDGSDINYL